MPCTYTETPEEIALRENELNAKAIAPYKKKLDKVTRLLCQVLTDCEILDDYIAKNEELKRWWEDHKKNDARRIKKNRGQ